MARSQQSWSKREKEKRKQKRKEEKQRRKELRQEEKKDGTNLEDMIAWVDAEGNPTDEKPNPEDFEEIKAEDIVLGIPPKEQSDQDETENKGVVTFFNTDRGYGFIKAENSNDNFFTHINSHIDEIKEGDKVNFDIVPGDKGPVAINVKLL